MTKEEILKEIVWEAFNNGIQNLQFNKDRGYENCFLTTRESYAKKLGKEFIKYNIPFESLYDIGYGRFDKDEKDIEVAKSFAEACKNTPNYIFLKDILTFEFQRDILLKSIEKFDFDACLNDFTKINSILHILRDFRSIGIDKTIINKEVTELVKIHVSNADYWHPNLTIAFINEGFFFDEEFMKKDFQKAFKYTFGHMGSNCNEKFEQIYCSNNENSIKFNYNNINRSLSSKEELKLKRNKI